MPSLPRNLLIVTGLVLGTTACPQRTAIWIEPGSTAANLVFHVAHGLRDPEGRINPFVEVWPCTAFEHMSLDDSIDHRVWAATAQADTPVRLIRYGDVSPAVQRIETPGPAPRELAAGCWVASTEGTGYVTFQVHHDGSVTQTKAVE